MHHRRPWTPLVAAFQKNPVPGWASPLTKLQATPQRDQPCHGWRMTLEVPAQSNLLSLGNPGSWDQGSQRALGVPSPALGFLSCQAQRASSKTGETAESTGRCLRCPSGTRAAPGTVQKGPSRAPAARRPQALGSRQLHHLVIVSAPRGGIV